MHRQNRESQGRDTERGDVREKPEIRAGRGAAQEHGVPGRRRQAALRVLLRAPRVGRGHGDPEERQPRGRAPQALAAEQAGGQLEGARRAQVDHCLGPGGREDQCPGSLSGGAGSERQFAGFHERADEREKLAGHEARLL